MTSILQEKQHTKKEIMIFNHGDNTSGALNGVMVGGHEIDMCSTILTVSCWKIGHGHIIL